MKGVDFDEGQFNWKVCTINPSGWQLALLANHLGNCCGSPWKISSLRDQTRHDESLQNDSRWGPHDSWEKLHLPKWNLNWMMTALPRLQPRRKRNSQPWCKDLLPTTFIRGITRRLLLIHDPSNPCHGGLRIWNTTHSWSRKGVSRRRTKNCRHQSIYQLRMGQYRPRAESPRDAGTVLLLFSMI